MRFDTFSQEYFFVFNNMRSHNVEFLLNSSPLHDLLQGIQGTSAL